MTERRNVVADHPSTTEQDPLLGSPRGTSQGSNDSYFYNLVRGTGIVAQLGVVVIAVTVWVAVFKHDLIVFSAHPLLNSAGVAFAVQGMLVLQPTHTPEQKRIGTYHHFAANSLAATLLAGGAAAILYNKVHNNIPHFESVHAYLGAITYILLIIQAFVGFTQFFVPQLYGGVDNAKKIYKYHRILGYFILLMFLITATAATYTRYAKHVLHMKTWGVVVGGLLVVAGVFPRIKKQKVRIW